MKEIYISDLGEIIANARFLKGQLKSDVSLVQKKVIEYYRNLANLSYEEQQILSVAAACAKSERYYDYTDPKFALTALAKNVEHNTVLVGHCSMLNQLCYTNDVSSVHNSGRDVFQCNLTNSFDLKKFTRLLYVAVRKAGKATTIPPSKELQDIESMLKDILTEYFSTTEIFEYCGLFTFNYSQFLTKFFRLVQGLYEYMTQHPINPKRLEYAEDWIISKVIVYESGTRDFKLFDLLLQETKITVPDAVEVETVIQFFDDAFEDAYCISAEEGYLVLQMLVELECDYIVTAKDKPEPQPTNDDDSTPKDLQASIAELQNLFGAAPKPKKRK